MEIKTEEIIGNINIARAEAYDKLMVSLNQNIDNIDKKQLLELINELLQDVKSQNNMLEQAICSSNDINLAMTYAHNTRNHIGRIDVTADNILSNAIKANNEAEKTTDYSEMFK